MDYTLPRSSFTLLAVMLLLQVTACCEVSGQQFSDDVEMISFDDQGRMSPTSINRLNQLLTGAAPSDVYIVSHGWNTSFTEARDSYRDMLRRMRSQAQQHQLLPATYKSLVLGVSWPSKAFDESAGRTLDNGADDVLAIYRSFPREKGGEDYEMDVQAVEELLSVPSEAITQEHFDRLSMLFAKYRISSEVADDRGFFELGTQGRGLFDSRFSIRQALRMFTYWQMKERAGIVGKNGVRPLLNKLQSTFSATRIHLVGHSFGCKLMLSCVGSGPAPARRVDTLLLMQGAVSYQALSPIGGYANVLARVSGPIAATYSENDSALGLPYELASQAAGQTAERSVSRYSALGKVGPEFGEARTIVPPSRSDQYQFASGVYRVHGAAFITEHSEFYNEAVARMIWAVVQSAGPRPDGSPFRSLGRSLDASKVIDAATKASRFVKESGGDASDEELIRIYTDTVESLLHQPRPFEPLRMVRFPAAGIDAVDLERVNTRAFWQTGSSTLGF